MKKTGKRGELTTTQLVTIIVLIVSFIIILFLIFRLNLGETTDTEICRNSVVLKGQSKLTSGPLDCKTSYVCISGGDTCQGISATETVKVDPKNQNEVMKAIADKMAECWYEFGEGKVNYGGGFTEGSVYYALCSVIAFDDKIQNDVPEISNSDFYSYLQKISKSQSQTYLQYLYATNTLGEFGDEKYFGFSLSDSIDTTKQQSILTGIDNNVKILAFGNDDQVLNTFIIPTDETSTRLVSDREFITKA